MAAIPEAPLSTPDSAQLAALSPLFAACCTELAQAYGVESCSREEAAARGAPDALVSRVHYSGADLGGDVSLTLARSFVEATLRSTQRKPTPISERMAADWAGELANQLIGRLKNKLRPYSISFELSVPRVFASSDAEPFEAELREPFETERGTFVAELALSTRPGLIFEERGEQRTFDEGDLLLF